MNRPLIFFTSIFLATAGMSCNDRATSQTESNGAQASTSNPDTTQTDCKPIETRDPNVPGQKPAFEGQTRVCAITSDVKYNVEVITNGLETPWAVEPLPDGDFLVTERPGRLRIVSASGQIGEPITGLPKIDAGGQGGLLDVALGPNFATDRMIYWSFTEPRPDGGNATSVARGVLSSDRKSLSNVQVVFQAKPSYKGKMHFGSRLNFGPDGMLYVTLGERSDKEMRPQAQHMDSHMGKTIRITPEGKPAPDNPFLNEKGALPEIWTVGHRNVQAATFDSEGRFWIVDHGPQGGDELNLIEKGKNYGWPLVTYGEEYSGDAIDNAVTEREGFVQPVYYWDPVIAPSGAQFYTGNAFPSWKGNLFVGGLRAQALVRLQIENGRVTGEEHLLTERGQRIRDVRQGQDGALYVVTDQQKGELLKIVPQQ